MDNYVFDPQTRTFVISKGASLGYASEPGLASDLPRFGQAAPAPGDYLLTITHNLNIVGLGVLASLNWPSGIFVWFTSANSFTLVFTASAPGNALVYWEVSSDMPTDLVAVDAVSHVISHYRGANAGLLVMPNWATMIWDSTPERTDDEATVYFSQPAPADAKLYWRAIG